jgi:hypothetical protein
VGVGDERQDGVGGQRWAVRDRIGGSREMKVWEHTNFK